MKKSKLILLKVLSAALALGLINFVLAGILFNRFATSVEPGWYAIIYPFGGLLQTIIVLSFFMCLAYLVYKLIWRMFYKFLQ
jgi:hypothetical protein